MKLELKEKLSKIKALVIDIDGTMTDGSMYYDMRGEVFKRFNVKDGMGITLLKKAGFLTAFLTSETTPINDKRAEKLKIDIVIQGSRNKTEDVTLIAKRLGIELSQIAYIGDDVNDLHAMKLAGFSAAPSDAYHLIKSNVDYICENMGGHGAVRELCEMILVANEKKTYLDENW
jgi:3-deoxy-D-manno-octulosonate 8-phosphate phosphatase (KDO 8-P phosphatase)